MPEPLPLRKVLGPSVILAGVGVGSGEYILWPYISANAGIGFLYLAVVGVTIQYFLNMEIERYTLATGETAIAGFARSWKPWGILFCVFAIVPEHLARLGHGGRDDLQLPGRAATRTVIAMIVLLAIGVALTHVARGLQGARRRRVLQGRPDDRLPGRSRSSPRSAVRLGRPGRQRVATSARCRPTTSRSRRCSPASCSRARAGRTTSSSPTGSARRASAWARTSPRIESPITGEPEPAPTTGSMVRQDEENIAPLPAAGSRSPTGSSSSRSGPSAWPRSSSSPSSPTRPCSARTCPTRPTSTFIQGEGEVLKDVVGAVVRDVLLDLRLDLARARRARRRRLRRAPVRRRAQDAAPARQRALERVQDLRVRSCGRCACSASPSWPPGFDQPLVLLVLSACLNGIVMFIYSILLIKLNRTGLPPAIRVRGLRLGVLVLRRAVLRLLRRLVRDRPDGGDLLDARATPVRPLRRLRRHVHRAVRGGDAAGALTRPSRPWTIGRVASRPIQVNMSRTRTDPHGGGELYGRRIPHRSIRLAARARHRGAGTGCHGRRHLGGVDHRHRRRRPEADRVERLVDRAERDDDRPPVAALRLEHDHQLRVDRRRDLDDLHADRLRTRASGSASRCTRPTAAVGTTRSPTRPP